MFRGYYTVDLFDCPPFQMFTNGDDPRATNILEQKSFEPHSMRLWCRLAREATSILDIGAHTGVYALAAASLRKDIEIHAFEPNPYAAARLRIHKHLNGFTNLIEHPLALSEAEGITEITWIVKPRGHISSGAGIGPERPGWEKAPAYTTQLDSLGIDPGGRAVVKIDVEGTEENVLRGMTRFLEARPVIILESFRQPKCDAITAMLPGYSFALINETGAVEMRDRLIAVDGRQPNTNQLCIPGPWAVAAAGLG